jgi:hypothetical protein
LAATTTSNASSATCEKLPELIRKSESLTGTPSSVPVFVSGHMFAAAAKTTFLLQRAKNNAPLPV